MADIDHAKREHALLSASSAKQWLACPPSARLNDEIEDVTSSYAAEGTRAHELANQLLELEFGSQQHDSPAFGLHKEMAEEQLSNEYPSEMWENVNEYVQHCTDIVNMLKAQNQGAVMTDIETQVDYSTWATSGFGTLDFRAWNDKELRIVDLKYGVGVEVHAEDNPQLRLYALGCLDELDWIYPLQIVAMHIFQPRKNLVTEERLTVQELRAWGETIKPIAKQAFAGEGQFSPGDHCIFCGIKNVCRARAEANLELARYDFAEPAILDDDEVAEILDKVKQLKKWAEDVQDYALDQAVNHGKKWTGYKLVEGRGRRNYSDEAAAIAELEVLFDESAITEPRKLLSVSQLEKTIGKKVAQALVGDYVERTPGNPTLAKEDDPRPEFGSPEKARKDFAEPYTDN